MQIEEARGFVFQALRAGECGQWSTLVNTVGRIKSRVDKVELPVDYEPGLRYLKDSEKTLIMEIVWSLIVQGILIPGVNDNSQGWPFLRLTEYGRRCVDEDRVLPHDPEGYLRDFRAEVINADTTIIEYLTESLQCYLRGLNRAAAVMLGGASEKAILMLIDAYGNGIANPTAKRSFHSSIERLPTIFRKYDVFEKHFSANKQKFPKSLTENVDSLLRGVFDLIRNSRNDAGHPASGSFVNRDIVYSHLRLFTPYCKRVYELISWLAANQV